MPTLCCHPSTDSKSLLDSYNIRSNKWCACPRTVIQGWDTAAVEPEAVFGQLDNQTLKATSREIAWNLNQGSYDLQV
jgi:hypothetical protein